MASRAKRPGQVRFEAWVPEDLYRQFQRTRTARAPWLRAAMAEHVAGAPRPKPEPVVAPAAAEAHRHRRTATGEVRYSLGQAIPVFACADCGEVLS